MSAKHTLIKLNLTMTKFVVPSVQLLNGLSKNWQVAYASDLGSYISGTFYWIWDAGEDKLKLAGEV
jgi:hypothetical protein